MQYKYHSLIENSTSTNKGRRAQGRACRRSRRLSLLLSPRTVRDGGSLCVVYAGGETPLPNRLNPPRQPSSEAARPAITTLGVAVSGPTIINVANIPTKIAHNSFAFRHTYLLAPTAGLQALIYYIQDDSNDTKDGTKDSRRNCLVRSDCILHSYRKLAAITTLAFTPADGHGGGDCQERFSIESLEVWGCCQRRCLSRPFSSPAYFLAQQSPPP
jgi:hypothetical protein